MKSYSAVARLAGWLAGRQLNNFVVKRYELMVGWFNAKLLFGIQAGNY